MENSNLNHEKNRNSKQYETTNKISAYQHLSRIRFIGIVQGALWILNLFKLLVLIKDLTPNNLELDWWYLYDYWLNVRGREETDWGEERKESKSKRNGQGNAPFVNVALVNDQYL